VAFKSFPCGVGLDRPHHVHMAISLEELLLEETAGLEVWTMGGWSSRTLARP